MNQPLTLEQLLFWLILQAVGFALYYLRTRTAAAKRDADQKVALEKQKAENEAALEKQKADNEAALKQQEANLQQQIADAEAESERRMTEAALIREQGRREEQQARAEIERQLIASHSRFADEIRANREASGELFGKVIDVLDHMSKRQETTTQTHNRNGEKIDDMKMQIKTGFDKADLILGEHTTLLTAAPGLVDAAAQRVIATVNESNTQIASKLASFDAVAATVTAISGDVSEVARHVRELQTLYAEAIPKIFNSMSKNANDADALSLRLENITTLVQRIGNSVNATEGSVVKIEEHIQAIQRELLLKMDEPPRDEADTEEMPPLRLTSSGDVPPQGGN